MMYLSSPAPYRRKRIPPKAVLLAIIMGLAGLGTLALSQAATDDGPPFDPNVPTETIIVQYEKNADVSKVDEAIGDVPAIEKGHLETLDVKILEVPVSERDAVIRELEADPTVKSAERDALFYPLAKPNDTYYTAQAGLQKMAMEQAWDKSKGDGVIVAVLDSGLNITHQEFNDGTTNKVVKPRNVLNDTADVTDQTGHGTGVVSIIGAITNNDNGMAGGCWNCKVMPIKIFAPGAASEASVIIKGIEYAINNGANIINMSFGGPNTVVALQSAVDNAVSKGIVVVAAAGNVADTVKTYPAAHNNVIAVGETMLDDTIEPTSKYGAWVDVGAPGRTHYAFGTANDVGETGGMSSASSAFVSSIAALLRQKFPAATVAEITDAIVTTGDPCCAGKIPGGRVNAAKAMAKLEIKYPAPTPTPTPTPTPPSPTPTPVTKTGDLNGDSVVNLFDMSILLANWNKAGTVADINKSGKVDLFDLSLLLANWNK